MAFWSGKRIIRLFGATGTILAAGILFASQAAYLRAGQTSALTITVNVKDVWPPAPIADLTAFSGSEGQVLVMWTSPDQDSGITPSGRGATKYFMKTATYSAVSVGNVETWWNAAKDVAGLPDPLPPGTTQSMLLNYLMPGVTYYFSMKSMDDAGNVSKIDVNTSSGTQAYACVVDLRPPAPANLQALTISSSQIYLTWNPVNVFDLDHYRLHIDSTPPYDFTHQYFVNIASGTTSYYHADLDSGKIYTYFVTAVDMGPPGYALESSSSNIVTATTTVVDIEKYRPMPPSGFNTRKTSSTVTVSWRPVKSYQTGSPFVSVSSPSIAELTGYRVYKATAPVNVIWTEACAVSSNTLYWSEAYSGLDYYYFVRAENAFALSRPSLVRSPGVAGGIIMGPDGASRMEIPESVMGLFDGSGAEVYSLLVSSHSEDIEGSVAKSLEFAVFKDGLTKQDAFRMDAKAVIKLHYEVSAGGAVTVSGAAAKPEDLSIFWFNGSKWAQLYGRRDTSDQTLETETVMFGRYQLRLAGREGGFKFDKSGLSNRILTPNGDGRNDNVIFTFDSDGTEVTGKIFDLKGAFVADLGPGPVTNSLKWDGKSNGSVVPGGIYIYQLKSGDKVFNGTVVVIR